MPTTPALPATASSALPTPDRLPVVIQGGMGVAVSSWQLAREVSQAGQLGVVSGTALDAVVARRLQDGDPDGHLRRALAAFPVQDLVARVMRRYYREGGRAPGTPYTPVPKLSLRPTRVGQELAVVANFAEVWLAKEGHHGVVGINFLEKVQMATPAAAFGAMLAGVDYVLMGAGIPTEVPRLLDALSRHETARLTVHVDGSTREHTTELDPVALFGGMRPTARRPRFLAIVSAHVLAAYLARDERTRPEGFVVEGPTAGGHNAPPRGRVVLDDAGQPVYGPRDQADLAKVAEVGLPFWVAGSQGTPEQVRAALAAGAAGVQVGTLFALSVESGIAPDLRAQVVGGLADGSLDVRTDPAASPTGFPFKVVDLPGTASRADVYEQRERLCDLGYLRVPYEKANGSVGYRCPAEPVDVYVRKGGKVEDTVGRKCLCNGLMADVDLGQTRRDGYAEVPLVTLGGDLDGARALLDAHPGGWTARQAVSWLVGS